MFCFYYFSKKTFFNKKYTCFLVTTGLNARKNDFVLVITISLHKSMKTSKNLQKYKFVIKQSHDSPDS